METLNKLKIILILLALTVFSSVKLNAQEYMTFNDAVKKALAGNHDIQMALNRAKISKNNIHIGNAGLLPSVDLVAYSNYNDNKINNIYQSSTYMNASVQASYTLFDGFGNIYTFNKLQVNGELGELEARYNIETILLSVSEAYYNLCSAEESNKIAQESVLLSQERLQRAENKSRYGQANSIDVLSAEVDLNADSVSFMNAQEALRETKRNFNILLNRNIDEDLTVNKDVTFVSNLKINKLINSAIINNASYLMTLKDLENAELDLKIANSSYYPSLILNTSYGYDKTNSEFNVGQLNNPDRIFSAGLTLNFNLYNGNKTNIKRQNAEITLQNNELMQKKALLILSKDVANGYEGYKNSLNVLDIRKRNLKSAQLNFDRAKELYDLGQVTSTTFREAQLNLIEAKNNIANAKYSAKLYEINLLRLSGQLVNTDENFNFVF